MNEGLQKQKKAVDDTAFYLESDFYETADSLRAQFEKQVPVSPGESDGMMALTYAFCLDAYQFLTASAERIFRQDAVEDFMEKLEIWAKDALGTTYVSTPQVRVYINGCGRELLQDSVNAQWHYMLSLTRDNRRHKTSCIKLMKESGATKGNGRPISVGRVIELQLEFNQLLVHSTGDAYSIEPAKTSMNPKDASVFLDGYLW